MRTASSSCKKRQSRTSSPRMHALQAACASLPLHYWCYLWMYGSCCLIHVVGRLLSCVVLLVRRSLRRAPLLCIIASRYPLPALMSLRQSQCSPSPVPRSVPVRVAAVLSFPSIPPPKLYSLHTTRLTFPFASSSRALPPFHPLVARWPSRVIFCCRSALLYCSTASPACRVRALSRSLYLCLASGGCLMTRRDTACSYYAIRSTRISVSPSLRSHRLGHCN